MKRSIQTGLKSKLMVLALLGMVVSCSKDNDGSPKPSSDIQAAVGTFKGKIRVAEQDYFNAIVIVSKEGNDKLKVAAKTGENYSAVTPKVFKVQNISNIHISSSGISSGSFTYTMDSKEVQISTNKEAATDVEFYFEGTKQ